MHGSTTVKPIMEEPMLRALGMSIGSITCNEAVPSIHKP